MDFFTHIIFVVVIGYLFHGTQIPLWIPAIIGAVLPDLIGETFYQIGRIAKGKKIKILYDEEVSGSHAYLGNSSFLFPYNLLHSFVMIPFLFLFLLPIDFIIAYTSHLLLDLFSHSKKTWGVMAFWPFSKKRFGGEEDWWQWRVYKKLKSLFKSFIINNFL